MARSLLPLVMAVATAGLLLLGVASPAVAAVVVAAAAGDSGGGRGLLERSTSGKV
jgi:hypothetical protein